MRCLRHKKSTAVEETDLRPKWAQAQLLLQHVKNGKELEEFWAMRLLEAPPIQVHFCVPMEQGAASRSDIAAALPQLHDLVLYLLVHLVFLFLDRMAAVQLPILGGKFSLGGAKRCVDLAVEQEG